MCCLRDFCNYVLLRPHIPGTGGTTFIDKYGPLTQTITKYDLVIHSQDRPRKKRYALATPLLDDVYEFARVEYLPKVSVPHLAARNAPQAEFHSPEGRVSLCAFYSMRRFNFGPSAHHR